MNDWSYACLAKALALAIAEAATRHTATATGPQVGRLGSESGRLGATHPCLRPIAVPPDEIDPVLSLARQKVRLFLQAPIVS
jgi:hypothetical protein